MNPEPRKEPRYEELFYLGSHGFFKFTTAPWLFIRESTVFDLSAANLDMIETIWAKKQFVIAE